jgi:hypothetical protein
MMGAYEYDLATADIPEGTIEILVKVDGVVIRTIEVTEDQDDVTTYGKTETTDDGEEIEEDFVGPGNPTSGGSVSSSAVMLGLVALGGLFL